MSTPLWNVDAPGTGALRGPNLELSLPEAGVINLFDTEVFPDGPE
jgi:hypothetical protein